MRRAYKFVVGGFVIAAAAIALLVIVWNWDWFIPFVAGRAGASLGRPVSIAHLHVTLARNPIIEADGLVIGNPRDFPADAPPLARIERLGVTLDGWAWLRHRTVGLLEINVIHPVIEGRELPDGKNNWTFASGGNTRQAAGGSRPTLGAVHIEDGLVHAVVPRLRADIQLAVKTEDPPGGTPPEQRQKESRLVANARGTYAGQPITGSFAGGALLAIRDRTNPYPVDLRLQNGPSHVVLQGTLLDPTAFGGADVRLDLAGRNLADLTHLVGFALPDTRPYRLTGRIDYADHRVRFTEIKGQVGQSDLEGQVTTDPGQERQQVTAELSSNRVDMADLQGFLGSNPNAPPPPPNAPLLSTRPINLPAMHFADIDLKYRGKRLEGHFQPLDNVVIDLTIRNGAITLHPVSFGVGKGSIKADAALTPQSGKQVHARADISFRQVDLGRMLSATHAFQGAGVVGGYLELDGTGPSLAGIVGNADGETKLFMTGGDISALLVDLSGLEFGNSLLSALGLPKKTQIRCMVADLPIRRGVMASRTLLLDTKEANVTATGSVNMRNETLDLRLNTEAKHFSIGSLPGPIVIGGHLRSPAIRPGAEVAARAGIAAGLGALLSPLAALLPTIQLGLGEDNNCSALIRSAQGTPNPAAQKPQAR